MMRMSCFLLAALVTGCTVPGEAPSAMNANGYAESDSVKASMNELLKMFNDTSFDELHVFAYEEWIEQIDQYPGYFIDSISFKDNLRFKGEKIPSPHASLLSIPELEQYYDIDYFASFRFGAGKGYEGLIVRAVDRQGWNTVNGIWLFVLDTAQRSFVSRIELARKVGEELYFSTAQSWIIDMDKDGMMDVLMRTRNEEAGNTGLSLDADDTLTASVMSKSEWSNVQVNNYDATKKQRQFRMMNVVYP